MGLPAFSHISTFNSFSQSPAVMPCLWPKRIVIYRDVVEVAPLREHNAVSQKHGVILHVPHETVAVIERWVIQWICARIHDHAFELDSLLEGRQIPYEGLIAFELPTWLWDFFPFDYSESVLGFPFGQLPFKPGYVALVVFGWQP